MVKHWKDREYVKAGVGSSGLLAHICWLLGVAFAVLGVIGEAIDTTLGLESMSWYLLSIAAFGASIFPSIGWAVSWYLRSVEPKSKKKE
jgi:hypothetical protein